MNEDNSIRENNTVLYRNRKECGNMVDYEYLFAKTVHDKLWEHVHGKIFAAVKDDELYVKIQNRTGLIFETTFGNFACNFINGMSTEDVVYEVMSRYRKFVMKEYFK